MKKSFRTSWLQWLQIIIGTAKRSGATDEEIDTLVKAFKLANKYWPTPKKKES